MKNKLSTKLLASFAAVLLLFTIVMGGIFLVLFQRHTVLINRDEMQKKAVSIAGTLSSFENRGTGGGHGGMGGYGAYLRFLNELAMAEVWIVDENMEFMTYGHGQMYLNASVSLPEHAEEIVKKVFCGEVTYGKEFSELLASPSLTVGAPIFRSDGSISSAVLLHSPIDGIEEAVRQGGIVLAAGAGIALLFAVSASFLLAYVLTEPLNKMKHVAVRLADGDYTAQVKVTEHDEIGELANVLNLLADRLAEAEKQRMEIDQLREDFVTNVSHELRTPVAVLRGSLEMLQDGTVKEAEETADYYEQMLLESRHLERLVNDLLDLSRLQDAGFVLERKEVNLCDVVRDISRSMRRLGEKKNVVITTQYPEAECMVFGDYGRLRQMLLILMDNAIKFSVEGSTIKLRLQENAEKTILSVADQGIDILPEDMPFIFERFKKTGSRQNKSGSGLGLAIAKQIAERHGAAIHAESKEGVTTFTIVLSKEV